MSAGLKALLGAVVAALFLHAEGRPTSVPVHVRLLTPVASYSKKGAVIEARVIGTLDPNVESPLPPGTLVRGSVTEARSIGLGIRNERAALELSFSTCDLPDGQTAPCQAVLMEVDNARESVSERGRIQGILAASHPHSWLGGVWYRPATAISGRSASGLTGVGGKLQSVVAPSPLGAAIAVVSRLILFRLPDAEIELPGGTDLIVEVTTAPPVDAIENAIADDAAPTGQPSRLSAQTISWLTSAAAEVTLSDGRLADDIINIVFMGTEEQLAGAFLRAGWSSADPLTPKTFARSYAAVAGMRNYPTAPVSPLHYESRLPDAVYQKSFNSLSKRHHIRLWRVDTPDVTFWLGAATHDVAAAFDWSRISLTHKIDPNIDVERRKVLYDLREPACIAWHEDLERPNQTSIAGEGAFVTTDGSLTVARLQACSAEPSKVRPLKRPRKNIATVIARRFVLEARHYMTRGNAYYWAYRGIRWTFTPTRDKENAERPPDPSVVKIVLNPATPGTVHGFTARPSS